LKPKNVKKLANVEPTFDDVKRWHDENMHPSKMNFDDPKPYEVYSEGRYAGIFQLTSQGAQRLFKKAKPKSVIDIAALTSIYRPGPLAANVDKLWLEHEHEPYDWGHPLINDTLKKTRGCIAGGSLVLTDEGDLPIEIVVQRLNNGEKVTLPTFNEETSQFEQDEVIAGVRNGLKETIVISTKIGELHLTPDHNVLTIDGWKRADELTLNDEIIDFPDYLSFKKEVLKDE
jgi:hypothetical protein